MDIARQPIGDVYRPHGSVRKGVASDLRIAPWVHSWSHGAFRRHAGIAHMRERRSTRPEGVVQIDGPALFPSPSVIIERDAPISNAVRRGMRCKAKELVK